MAELGNLSGEGTAEGEAWVTRAVELGDGYGCALRAEWTNDEEEDFKWNMKAAQDGWVDAMYNVGYIYEGFNDIECLYWCAQTIKSERMWHSTFVHVTLDWIEKCSEDPNAKNKRVVFMAGKMLFLHVWDTMLFNDRVSSMEESRCEQAVELYFEWQEQVVRAVVCFLCFAKFVWKAPRDVARLIGQEVLASSGEEVWFNEKQ
jgi:hypothetical protein